MQPISQNEFAKRKKVTPSKVTKAIQNGRIKTISKTNRKIDWDTQSIEWDQNQDISKIRDHNPPPNTPPEYSGLSTARLAKETYTAKLRQIEYEKEIGKLMERDLVKTVLFRFTRFVRDGITTIPDRVAADFTARVITYLKPMLNNEFGVKAADKFLQKVKTQDIERISAMVWNKESREILEELSNGGPKV